MIALVFIALLQAAPSEPAPSAQSAPATTAQAVEQSGQQTAAAPPSQEQLRCRREVITGTRLTHRVCTTQAQDEALEAEARSLVNRVQSQNPLQGN